MRGFIVSRESGRVYEVKDGVNTVGRVSCDIAVEDDQVNQQHAVVQCGGNCSPTGFAIQDLNSNNGIFLNNSNFRNASSPLNHGDILGFSPNGPTYEFVLLSSLDDAAHYSLKYRPASAQPPRGEIISLPVISASQNQPGHVEVPVRNNWVMQTPGGIWTQNAGGQSYQKFGNQSEFPPMANWAVQTQSGAWTQVAPIPPPKPPAFNLRGRPSSASSVSRLSRQAAVTGSRTHFITTDSHSRGSTMYVSGDAPQPGLITQPTSVYQTVPESAMMGGPGVVAAKIESLSRHIASRSNSRKDSGSALNETFNVNTPSNNSIVLDMTDWEQENKQLREQVQTLTAELSSSQGRLAELRLTLDATSGTVREKDIQIQNLQQQLTVTTMSEASEKEELRKALDAVREEMRTKQLSEEGNATEIELLREELESTRIETETLRTECEQIRVANNETSTQYEKSVEDLKSIKEFIEKIKSACSLEESASDETVLESIETFKSEISTKESTLATSEKQLADMKNEFAEILAALKETIASGSDEASRLRIESHETFVLLENETKQEVLALLSSFRKPEPEISPESERLRALINYLIEVGYDIGSDASKEDVKTCLKETQERTKATEQELLSLQERLSEQESEIKTATDSLRAELESENAEKVEAALAQLKEEHQQALEALVKEKTDLEEAMRSLDTTAEEIKQKAVVDAVEACKSEIEVKHAEEVNKVRTDLEEEMSALKTSHEEIVQNLVSECESLRSNWGTEKLELANRIELTASELDQKTQELEALRSDQDDLQTRLTAVSQEKSALQELIAKLETDLEAATESRSTEDDSTLKMLKMECQEHAKTIVKLEEKIIALSHENQQNIEARNTALSEKQEVIEKFTREKPEVPPKPASVTPVRTMEDLYAMEQLVILLRTDLAEARKTVREYEIVIDGLRKDLAGANARLADVAGELSESQKEEVEKCQALARDLESQLQSVKAQLEDSQSQKSKVDQQNEQFDGDLRTSKQMIEQLKKDLQLKESQISELNRQLFTQVEENERQVAIQREQTKIAEELSGMGAQCKGERHLQVMQRQKEALSDLRHRIKLLEQNRPPIPTADQALGQVALLQRELAELRAQQSGGTGQDLPGLDIDDEEFMDEETGEVKKSRGKIETALLKSNRIENAEALELSEKSYFNLTKSLARRMGLEKMNGNQTMAHISREEREKLFVEREKDIENINTNVNSLFSRVERKDELLNNYEKDLNKLREMENIASQKQKELLKSNADLRAKKEEIDFIREALRRTKEDYEREKRLNAAIKATKGEYLDQFEKQSKGGLKGRKSEPDDIMGKEARKKREDQEKLKKKTYELEKLKEELREKENKISELSVKIVNYESTAEVH